MIDDKFVAFFGIRPVVISVLWAMLLDHTNVAEHYKVSAPKVQHLFYALCYLRQTWEEVISEQNLGCDAKTLRKWAWTYIQFLSELTQKLVRDDHD